MSSALKVKPRRWLQIVVLMPPGFILFAAGILGPAQIFEKAASQSSTTDTAVLRERLTYRVEWSPPWYLFFLPRMEAGEAVLSLFGEIPGRDRKTAKILFTARSSGTLVRMAGIAIDDRFVVITDAETYCTISVSKQEREGKRMRDIDVTYLPEGGKLHLREVDVASPDHKVLRDQDYEGIPTCVQDLFSSLYSYRCRNLSEGLRMQALVGDNQNVKEIEIRVGKKTRVSTSSGSYDAWQIDTISLVGGLFKGGGHFRLWLSADDRKMPVKFEVSVNLGKVTGSLKKAEF